MKAKKQKIYKYIKANRILTLAGMLIIITGILANLFSIYNNKGFINQPISIIYYSRFIILLGGGLIVGYLLSNKNAAKKDRLFLGVNYAVLAVSLSWVFDLVRVIFQNIFGFPPYPWGMIIFEGLPILPLIATLILAYFSQFKPKLTNLSKQAKIALITSFLAWGIYNIFSGFYYVIIGTATFATGEPIWQIIISYITMPITIAIIAYLALNPIKQRFDRLFFAAFIASLYSVFIMVLWEFRTDASAEATTIFSNIITFICLLFTSVVLWQVRKSIK